MKNLGKKIANNKLYIITFIISLAIITILYKLNDVTPLGGKSLLCIDFYHQYGPMLGELYDRIHNFSGLSYSFNMALGLPFFRNFLNYLSSPFNLIMLLFRRKDLVTSYSFIIGLKACTSSVTFVYFISKKFNNKKLSLIPLGLLYAFQAYFTAYYWNIMWLDGMVFLPIITLGIENIINKKTWKLYTFSLAIMLIANYFIGYMICIFSVVYFIFYNIYKTKWSIKNIKESIICFLKNSFMFGISSLAAGCLVAFLLLPMASSMRSISATGGSIPTSQYYSFKLVDYLFGHLTGTSTTVFASDTITNPNVSCGIFSVACLLLYLINLEIPLKNKICYLLILGFFILAFFSPALDYILHAFHVPNDLPYRYSFLYSFVLMIIAAYGLINLNKIKFPVIAISYLLLMVMLIVILDKKWEGITDNMIYINMILLTLYLIFYASDYFLNCYHNLFYLGVTVIVAIDVIVSVNYNWDITQVLKVFYEDYDKTEELLKYVRKNDDELFYRIENTNMMTLNDPSWYNYYGMTTFTSMAYEDMAILQHNLGMPGNEINSYYYVQSTPIYDMMFDLKYFIGNSNDDKRYKSIKTIDETANLFKYNVGLIYGVNREIDKWEYTSSNPFRIQNDFIKKATGVENVLETATLISTDEVYNDDANIILKYEYENTGDNFYFYTDDYNVNFVILGETLYYKDDNYSKIVDKYPDINYSYLDDYNESNIINIKSEEDKITLYIAFNSSYSTSFNMYTINNDKFEEAYEILNKHKFDMHEFKENYISGSISLDDYMTIYTSIPYDEGWNVYIDGKKVKTEALGDSLLTFDCHSGTHKITLKYKAPYMRLGTIISILTLVNIFLIDYYQKRKKIKAN